MPSDQEGASKNQVVQTDDVQVSAAEQLLIREACGAGGVLGGLQASV